MIYLPYVLIQVGNKVQGLKARIAFRPDNFFGMAIE